MTTISISEIHFYQNINANEAMADKTDQNLNIPNA